MSGLLLLLHDGVAFKRRLAAASTGDICSERRCCTFCDAVVCGRCSPGAIFRDRVRPLEVDAEAQQGVDCQEI